MSERGSFVTEYIHCAKCLEVIKNILCRDDKYLKGVEIPMWSKHPEIEKNEFLPIIAGKIGGSYSGEEINIFEYELLPIIKSKICHEIRVAILAENGEKIFNIKPVEMECPKL